jgi:23S rRNA U2552 (ribose-2'-O)-methylase RlmE/FtsJ
VKPIKPKASRDKSSETFMIGIGVKELATRGTETH